MQHISTRQKKERGKTFSEKKYEKQRQKARHHPVQTTESTV